MQLQAGTYLQGDKYRIIRCLGNGGFGITYLAEHELAGRNVCIKEFFPKEYYDRDEDSRSVRLGTRGSAEIMDVYKQKFMKEAKTIARLDHPNIIRIHDVFAENGTAYYVMDYVEGDTLSAMVKSRGALVESEALSYVRAVADALAYIHEQRIMHLDIKPANIIMRGRDNRAILIDFGLSKQYDAEGNQTSSTPVGISAGYAPMEQYQQGGVKEFSPETDIYSLGATLYYLVTGNVPPQAATIVDEGLPELPSHLSKGVRSAIERSMEIQRKRRPHSIKEFLALLDEEDRVVAPVAMPAPVCEETVIVIPKVEQQKPKAPKAEAPKPESPKKRSKWWLWLLLLLIVAVGGVVVLSGGDDSNSGDAQTATTSNKGAEQRNYAEKGEKSTLAEFDEEPTDTREVSYRYLQPQGETVELKKIRDVEEKEEAPATEQTNKPKDTKVQPKVVTETLPIESNKEKIEVPELKFSDDVTEFEEFSFDEEAEVNKGNEEDEIFTILEDPATFRGGGLAEFRQWVMERVRYPQIALENGIQGNVIIEFVIDENGDMTRIKVLQSPDPVLSDAAVAVLQKSPKWKPGKQRGKAVKMKFVLPVSFKFQNS